jgi:RelE-like toxin of type II toxin-antitoxin system HigB
MYVSLPGALPNPHCSPDGGDARVPARIARHAVQRLTSDNCHPPVDMWSLTVTRNWRLVFRFEDGDAFEVDLVDYH